MNLNTDLEGRIRNTSLPKSHSLLPLIEAVVNGLQAIDARFGDDVSSGRLRVTVQRSLQEALDLDQTSSGRSPLEPIVGFVVEDNGEGFTPANLESFQTLDSGYKANIGCRGVGRLIWLKAFDRAEVDSTFLDAETALRHCRFRFTSRDGVALDDPGNPAEEPGAKISLIGFRQEYQKNAPKTGAAIAREILEHCLWYFVRPGGAPEVTLIDDEAISLNTLLEAYTADQRTLSQVVVKGVPFDMVNLRLRSLSSQTPRLYWCAASRVVLDENLTGRLPGLHGRLRDGESEFTYVCFLSSDYLDSNVRADRTAFDITDRVSGTLSEDELSLDDIRTAVLAEVETLLADPLRKARDEGKERVAAFVSNRAPRYRPVLTRLEQLGLTVDPTAGDRELELQLHRNLQDLETQVLREGQTVLADAGPDLADDYSERLRRYLEMVDDIKRSDLAAYVSRRKVILEILAKLIELGADGKYQREAAVHTLLMPMRTDSSQLAADASNLWIIDERLAFHDYLASDKPLSSMPAVGSSSAKEPDILATRLVDSPFLAAEGTKLPLTSIVVVEIKRPMRNDASADDKNPISQALDYLERVREGGVTTASGRPIPHSSGIPGYCYVIADLTPTMVKRCKDANLRPTQDGLGYFGYNDARSAYVEVISFNRLLNAATERNRAFFDKLGLPTT